MTDWHGPTPQETARPADFGRWLQAWRHKRRISQRALAESLGYDVTYIAKIEGGTRPPTRQFLARLAQVSGTPEEPLLRASFDDMARPPLPCAPDALIGRNQEMQEIVDKLSQGARCVTLVGPPGIGKTRLALAVATHMDTVLLSGSWWVSLLDVTKPDEVVHRIRQELGLSGSSGADPLDGLVSRLRGYQALLALDNFEHVITARSVVSALTSRTPGLSILVTSRERLGLQSEHLYPVRSLRCPDVTRDKSLEGIRSSAAVALYVARASMADPSFRLDDSNGEAIARTCVHLDGIPLALVLSAGGIGTEGIAAVERRAEQHREARAPTLEDLPPHHQTLEAAIATSWGRLASGEASFFARLAVFQGGCTPEAAAVVGGYTDTGGAETAALMLDTLVRKSLLEARPDAPSGPRFELLQTIRSFAAARLQDAGLEGDARWAHLSYFVDLADRYGRGLLGNQQAQSLRALGDEVDNLQAAFTWALSASPDDALRLGARTWRYFLGRDIPTGRRWLESALAASSHLTHSRAEAFAAAGALAWVTGRTLESDAYLTEALALAEQLGSPDVAALAWLNRGALCEQRGELDGADDAFVSSLRLYASLGDDRGRACALIGRGMICRRRGDIKAGCDYWTTASQLLEAVGDRFNRTMALGNLAWAAEQEGRLDEARDLVSECRTMQIALGDVRGLAISTAGLGRLAFKGRSFTTAARLGAEALVAFQRLDDRPWAASTLVSLAASAAQAGRWRDAMRFLGTAQVLWDGMGAVPRGEDEQLRLDVLATCTRHMSSGEVARASGAGRALALEDAVDLARALA